MNEGCNDSDRTGVERRSSDAGLLQSFGYDQQLSRSMGAFASFAISFSLISVMTGIFAGFSVGIRSAGPAVVWSWLVVVFGQLLTALVLAELSVHFPLSGYGYQWTARLVNPRFGFAVAWLLLLQFTTGFPGVCKALGDNLHAFLAIDSRIPWLSSPWLTVVIITAMALVHLSGVRMAARVNGWGVVAEIGGVLVITTLLLFYFGVRRPGVLAFLSDRTNAAGELAGIAGFAMSMLLGAWCLTGFEAAAGLAEETHDPRVVVPRAIVGSLLMSGLIGFLLLMGFVLAIDGAGYVYDPQHPLTLRAVQAEETAPLQLILQARFGPAVSTMSLCVAFVSIFACGVASMATATRLIFSLARDRMLPCSEWLSWVDPVRQTPRNTIVAVWIDTSLVVLALKRLDLITSISAICGYLGYAGILLGAIRGFRSPHGQAMQRGSLLRGWRVPIAIAALVWSVLLIFSIGVPPILKQDYTSLISTAVALLAGISVYAAFVRRRIACGQAGPRQARPEPACNVRDCSAHADTRES